MCLNYSNPLPIPSPLPLPSLDARPSTSLSSPRTYAAGGTAGLNIRPILPNLIAGPPRERAVFFRPTHRLSSCSDPHGPHARLPLALLSAYGPPLGRLDVIDGASRGDGVVEELGKEVGEGARAAKEEAWGNQRTSPLQSISPPSRLAQSLRQDQNRCRRPHRPHERRHPR